MATTQAGTARRVLVTGGTRGIGREVCRQLALGGDQVLLGGRDPEAARRVASEVGATPLSLDVGDADSIARAAAELRDRHGALDVLVHNAGVSLDGFDAEVVRRTLAVNFHAPLSVTDALVPMLSDSGNVVMVSSGMGSLDCLSTERQRDFDAPTLTRAGLLSLMDDFQARVADGSYAEAGYPDNAYCVSKVGLNALTRVLSRQWAGSARRVNAVCPGWVRTDMGGRAAPRGVAEGARGVVWAATLDADGPSGGFFRDGHRIPW